MADALEEYILKRIEGYANSAEGKAQIKKQYGIDLKKKHIYVGDPKKENVSESTFIKYGEQMKQILYAYTSPLIKSITLDDIIVGKPMQDKNGQLSIEISFRKGSLHRDSLYDGNMGEYVDGLKNIVLLFAKGYHAKNYVYGFWDVTGGRSNFWLDWKDVRSRKDRSGDDFLIKAVNEFNTLVGKDVAKAELLGAYKECSENPN